MAFLLQIKNRILYFTNKVKLNFIEFRIELYRVLFLDNRYDKSYHAV